MNGASDRDGQPGLTLQATAVAIDGRALMIRGAPGSGKSGLALEMMARGATLVADDGLHLSREGGSIVLRPPHPLRGLIEARGLGLLSARFEEQARLVAVLDLDLAETQRFPPRRDTELLGQKVPLLYKFASPYFPAALVQYLRGERRD